MAIDGLVKSGTESKWGWSQESTFGTPLAASTNYFFVEAPMPTIDYGVTQVQEVRNRGQRYLDYKDTYISEKSGTRVISFSDWIVRLRDAGELLYAVTQTASESATTPFQKTFSIASTTTQPDFSADAGYFATLFIDNILSGRDQIFSSCILRTLTLSANTSEGDGRLMASGELISGFSSDNTQTLSGTPVINTPTYFDFSSPSLQQIASIDVVVKNWEITINNNAVRVGNDSSGDCQTYACGMPYDITGSITLKWDTNTDAHLTKWLSGASEKLQITYGTTGVTGYLDFTLNRVEYTGNERDFTDQIGQLVTLNFKAVGDSGTTPLCDFQVADGFDQTW